MTTKRAEYEFRYYNPSGDYVFSILNYHGANFWVRERDVGSFYIDIPYIMSKEILSKIEIDGIFEIYRTNEWGVKELIFNKRWFVRLWRDKIEENGVKFSRIRCVDCNNLVDRRIVYYLPQSPQTIINNIPADDAIKRLARENFGNLAVERRDWSDKIFIEEDFGLAHEISLDAFQYRKLLPLMGNICDTVREEHDQYLTFNVYWSENINKYVFETKVDQLGTNRGVDSESPLHLTAILGEEGGEFGGLRYASVELNAVESRTAVYAGGQGDKENRIIKEAFNQEEIDRIPFGLWESWQDARMSGTPGGVQAVADRRLQRWTPQIAVNGHISSDFTKYLGSKINWGDRVVFRFRDHIYEVNITSITINLANNGSEIISLKTRNMREEYYG